MEVIDSIIQYVDNVTISANKSYIEMLKIISTNKSYDVYNAYYSYHNAKYEEVLLHCCKITIKRYYYIDLMSSKLNQYLTSEHGSYYKIYTHRMHGIYIYIDDLNFCITLKLMF